MFRGSVKGTGYPLHSLVSPSLPLPCVTVCHHVSNAVYTSSPSWTLPLTTSKYRGSRVSWLKQLTLLKFSVLWKVPLRHWATGSRLYKGKHHLKSRGRWQYCIPSKRRGTLAHWSTTASHETAVLWKRQNSHSNASGLCSGGARIMRGFRCFL